MRHFLIGAVIGVGGPVSSVVVTSVESLTGDLRLATLGVGLLTGLCSLLFMWRRDQRQERESRERRAYFRAKRLRVECGLEPADQPTPEDFPE